MNRRLNKIPQFARVSELPTGPCCDVYECIKDILHHSLNAKLLRRERERGREREREKGREGERERERERERE